MTTLGDCSNASTFHLLISAYYLTFASLCAVISLILAHASWIYSSNPCIFSSKVFSHVSLARMVLYFYSLSNCTSTSKLWHLVCQVSFSIYIWRNFCLMFFKHPITNSISSLCLTNVVVNISSCQTATFFISSITWVNVSSIITKFGCKTFKIFPTSLSSTWVFSNFD